MTTPKHFMASDGWVWRRSAEHACWHTILPKTAERMLGELSGRPREELQAAMSAVMTKEGTTA